jgi:peptide/nickel transport system substrate-binding protein
MGMKQIRLASTFLLCLLCASPAGGESRNQLRFCLAAEPKTMNPVLVDDDASETIRYLTGGVLVRLNRASQQLEPELASSWKINSKGNAITFTLRPDLRFSDGTPFSADDVAFTMQKLMDPEVHSPTGDAFRSSDGKISTKVTSANQITISFPTAIVGLDKLFDQVAIMSARSPRKEMAVLGPYYVAENKAGASLLLKRNPNYWKHDSGGHQLPYIESILLDIQQNRDIEMLRLMRGEIDLINSLNADYFDRLAAQAPRMAFDAGVSQDSEQMWFNQVPNSPLPAYKKAWFNSTAFRRAISESINREDMARVVFHGHAQPAVSWISPANKFWFDPSLRPHPFNRGAAFKDLAQDGFSIQGGTLRDRDGHPVEFSIITNAGNKYREQMAAMIQQDLAGIGIRLNVVTLDFPSIIERITRNFNYEACLLGTVNVDLDPDSQMNVWLSSAENHQWNPRQKAPATPWEAQIDILMRAQAAELDVRKRKQAIDKVQEIVWQQEPFIYLVNRNALSAVSPNLRNAQPVVLRPQVYWNIEWMWLGSERAGQR